MKAVSERQNGSTTGVFVLGMHRSGTSAITQAVKALGFELGDNLMPAKPDNVKGFWEDWDIVKLNEQILRSDTGSWDRLSLFDSKSLSPDTLEQFIRQASEQLQGKFNDIPRFAIKDPRISLTLPIWSAACKRQHIETSHILCLRHPSSVASSLASRNEMAVEKALLLWLNHVYSILRDCGAPLLVVGYEHLLSDPPRELSRMAQFLGLKNPPAFSELAEQCLDKSLDHFPVDQMSSSGWLTLVDDLYRALSLYQDGSPVTREQQTQLLKELALDDSLIAELNNSAAATQRDQAQQHKLEAVIEENKALLASLTQVSNRLPHLDADGVQAAAELSMLKTEFTALKADRAEVDADRTRIDIERIKLMDISRAVTEDKRRLEEELAASKQELVNLSRIKTEKDELSARYTSLQTDFQAQNGELANAAAELADTRDQLATTRAELDGSRARHEHMSNELRELRLIRASRVWRMTAPLRWLLNRLYRFPGIQFLSQHRRLTLLPINHLEQHSDNFWTATDHDPQFLLLNNRYPVQPGSYEIRLAFEDQNGFLSPCLYIDYGAGFREEDSVMLSVSARSAKALVTVTDPAYQLRLDPFERKGIFSITGIRWRPLSKAEAVIRLTRHVIRKHRARGLTLSAILRGGLQKIQREGWSSIWRNTERYFSTEVQPVPESLTYDNWINSYERAYRTLRYAQTGGRSPKDTLPLIVIDHSPDAEAVNCTLGSIIEQRTAFGPILLLSSGDLPEESLRLEEIQHCREPSQYGLALQRFGDSLSTDHLILVRAGNSLSHYLSRALAIRLSKNPLAKLIYTDSDTLTDEAQRAEPQFKPAWNPDFELAAHYVGDTFAISAELIKEIPPVWLSHQEDALYALLATAMPLLKPSDVEHIPEVLWHKSAAPLAPVPLKRIQSILASLDVSRPVTAVESEDTSRGYRLHYSLTNPEPTVDIIIPTKDQCHLLKLCVESVLSKTRYASYRIVVVDNGSAERSTLAYLAELRRAAQCTVLSYPHPFNYSAINNFAVDQSTADVIVLMNNDIEVISPEWLREMVSHAIRPEVGCVGAKLYYPDSRIQHAGVILGIHGVAAHGFRFLENNAKGYLERLQYVQNYSAVTGACLAVRRDLYQSVAGLNEQDLAIDFNDIDFCLKVREAGYRNVWTPQAELYHHESATRGAYDSTENLNGLSQQAAYMTQRWGDLLINDPAYNPNLSLSSTGFELSTRYVGGVSLRQDDTPASISEHPYRAEPNISRVNQVLRLTKTSACTRRQFEPGLSIVILTLEKLELIEPLLEALVAAKRPLAESAAIDLQIIVGDTGSRDNAVHSLYQRLEGEITVVKEMKYHFSRCNNELFKQHVLYDAVLFLNNDIIFSDPAHTLEAMYTELKSEEDIAIVGTYLMYPNKRLQHGGVSLFNEGEMKGLCYHPGHNTDFAPPDDFEVREVPGVTGACLMMKSSQFRGCDYFDESYEAEAQDVDLCLKARRIGKKVKLLYCGEVIHHENATRPPGDANQRDRSRFIRKWRTYQEAIGVE